THLEGSNREYQYWLKGRVPVAEPLMNGPHISVVMPVYRPNLEHLRKAIASVQSQTYARWELCLTEDGSRQEKLSALLKATAAEDNRIRLYDFTENRGISAATNDAIRRCRGEYVAFMDQDDLLAPHALQEVAAETKRLTFDMLYSDED